MDTKPICPVCLKILAPDTPLGLCPECLIRAGFNTGTEPHSADEKKPRFIPPTITELAKHFPQLEILELIGQGGMGAVYKARQKQLDRAVALKILPPQVASGPGFAERFTREVRALAKLNHPHIVTLYEFGQTDGLFYFLMEFVDGVNLRQLLNNSRIAPKEALSIVPQICDALQYAHDRGIVHRDIKPENIILSKDGEVKIADFGVAKIVEQEPEEAGTKTPKEPGDLTEAGSVLGTPQYMAPEQISSPGEVDHRADIYALGVVFYQMLTGELPTGKLEPPSRKVQIDVRLDEIVLRALEKKPELRYQQASELKTQVETMVMCPPKPSSPEEEKSKLMNKKTVAAIAVVALLLTAVGYASWPTIVKTDQKGSAVSGPAQTNSEDQATVATTNENSARLSIELRDGSHVVGKNLDDTLRFHSTSLGDMKLAVSGIRSIVMAEDGATAKVTTTSGDMLDVQFITQALAVETVFGKTELPVKMIRSIKISPMGNQAAIDQVVMNTPNLLGYWRFSPEAPDKSIGGNYPASFLGNATVGPANSGPGDSGSSVVLDGNGSYVATTLVGGLASSGSNAVQGTIIAWFKLAALPSTTGRTFYLAGESVYQNDFDLQIEPDNRLKFYTDSTTATVATTPLTASDLNVWHFVAASLISNESRKIYLDGVLVGSSIPNPHLATMVGAFSIGESLVFRGRYLQGAMAEVAVFNRALSAEEIQSIYRSVPSDGPLPLRSANPPVLPVQPIIKPTWQPNVAPAMVATNETGFHLTIGLRDGSRVAGKSVEDTLHLHSASLGDVKLAVSGIRSIVMAEDGATAKVTTTSGDMLDVQFITQALAVETVFGKTELPVKMIRSIKISSLGKPGYLPPDLVGAWLEDGNGYDSRNGRAAVIEVPNSPALASMQQTHQLSFAAWIKPTSFPCEFPGLLVKGSTTQHDATFGGYVFTLNANGDNDLQFLSGALQIVTHNANGRWINHHMGEWIHVAFTLNAITRTAKFYVNGKPTDDEFIFGTWDGLNLDVPSKLFVGSGDPANGPNPIFEGQMQDMFLFNRALTADEIQTIYNADQPSDASFSP